MSVSRTGREPGWVRFFTVGIPALWVIGCGSVPPDAASTSDPVYRADRSLPPAACDWAPATDAEASTLIVLDWDETESPLDPDARLSGLHPADLPVYDDDLSSKESARAFKEAVRMRIETILCDLDPVDMRVIHGRAVDFPDATCVHLTIDLPPSGGDQAGQADYDACNRRNDDVAIVWGGRIAEVAGDGWLRDEWVNMLANVATHEIGHTLGFAHPDELGLMIDADDADRAIMLSSHTMSSLAGRQAFLIAQTTCPDSMLDEAGGVSYHITGAMMEPAAKTSASPPARARGAGGRILTCGHGGDASGDSPVDDCLSY
ncbi:MAG: hypothetical protein JSV19_08085 [Phycisphaerales bacterium]|nr:MAG: hypothetical protein JSV19_08085 [Phycisphaerales bacterium]